MVGYAFCVLLRKYPVNSVTLCYEEHLLYSSEGRGDQAFPRKNVFRKYTPICEEFESKINKLKAQRK